jgi:uncharacterized repeat protein (TIGR02543 family)
MRKIFTSLLLASSIGVAYSETAVPTSVTAITTTSANSSPSIAEIQTNIGTITAQLNWEKAPISSQNFVNYVNKGFYKNIVFHRVLKDFMMQTGGVDVVTGQFKTPDAPIVNESNNGLTNLKYTLAMARAAEPDTATSQFFINTKDNDFLNKSETSAGYAVFGEVISGKEFVDKINGYLTITTGYSSDGGVPVMTDGVYECGINFCLRKIYIENVYLSQVADKINSYTRINISGVGGRVTSSPSGISCISTSRSCTLKRPFGTVVSLTAKPSRGYEFKGWSGDCSGIVTPLVIDTKTKNNNCTATFAKKSSL